MNLTDVLLGTRRASWSDKKFHRQLLETLLEAQGVVSLSRAYVLGHASADLQTLARIDFCLRQKNARCLRRVFRDLPYGEDELGLTVIGPMCTVYLIIETGNRTSVAVIGNPTELPAPPLLLQFTQAEGFPYPLMFGKQLIIESKSTGGLRAR